MADPFANFEAMIQVLMASMKWATRVLQWTAQDKAVPRSDRYSATESLKVESRVIGNQTCPGEVIISMCKHAYLLRLIVHTSLVTPRKSMGPEANHLYGPYWISYG